METVPIRNLADNVTYMVTDGGFSTVVDPGDAGPVKRAIDSSGARLITVLLTHAHSDHTAGASELRRATGCSIVGPDECSETGLDRTVGEGDIIQSGPMTFRVLATPGHTMGHVCYHNAHGMGAVWTGDTLFVGGCGRIQKGCADEMWRSLCRLRDLSSETAVHTGHDYTLDNLEFATEVMKDDVAVARMKRRMLDAIESGLPAASSTVACEREANIFLRADTDAVRLALGMPGATPGAVFTELRRRKDER